MKRPLSVFLHVALAVVPAFAQTQIQLKWELLENTFKPKEWEGKSRAAFVLTNHDKQALPSKGWSLYFNSINSVEPGSIKGDLIIEYVSGNLFRIKPGPAFQGLAPGKSIQVEYLTTPLIKKYTDGPAGPYLVFDDAPTKGYAIKEYTLAPMVRPEQLNKGPEDPNPVLTAETLYKQNEAIQDLPAEQLPPVFPTPVHVSKQGGKLHLSAPPEIAAAPSLQSEARLAEDLLRPYFPKNSTAKGPALHLELGPVEGQSSPEAYELTVDPKDGIRVHGASSAGVFYGLQSLRDLMPLGTPSKKGIDVPAIKIVDTPRFEYRGFVLDVARNFQPKASILKVLELMSRYKLNKFHFHLTDDEGWRIEIPSLPELTTIGARRGHTLNSESFLPATYGSGPDVDKPFGSGYYTRADYIEILKYAAARHIEVIPELEMPGHARAAVKAMEARYRRLAKAGDLAGAKQYLLSDPDDQSKYSSAQLYSDNVMNPAMDSTYTFIAKVVSEVNDLYKEAGVPLQNLHMGGDEVPQGVWEKSPICQAYMKAKGLNDVSEFWYVFYGNVENILKPYGLPVSGWEEVGLRQTKLDGQPKNIVNPGFACRNFHLYVWNNVLGWGAEDLAYRLANGGYKVVLCPVSNLYLDMAYNKNPEEPGYYWGGLIDIEKPYEFIPYDYFKNAKVDRNGNPLNRSIFLGKDRLTDYGKQNILGIQGCLWAENLNEEGRMEYLLMPKLLGVAERAWAANPAWATEAEPKAETAYREAWSTFANVVGKRVLPRLEQDGIKVGYRVPSPGLKVVDGQVRCNIQLPGFALRYTTNGSEPNAKSPVVAGPIVAKGTIRVAAFDPSGRRSHVSTIENR